MSTLKTNTLDTPSGSGNITVNRPTILTAGDIVTADLANDAVTTVKLVNDAVTEAKIVNNAVTLAKMAGGTDGNIISYDASGDPVAVVTGSSGQVLTSAGAGAPPTFAAAAGGGKLVQAVNVTNSTYASGTTLMPNDATIPQITEGDEYMTLAITPTNSSNKLLIIWNFGIFATNGGQAKYSALFQDSTANALASAANQDGGANNQQNMTGFHYMAAGTTSSTTFRIRAGVNATDTFSFNGAAGGDRHSTAGASSITIFEIEV